jgi:hypothetical protein
MQGLVIFLYFAPEQKYEIIFFYSAEQIDLCGEVVLRTKEESATWRIL